MSCGLTKLILESIRMWIASSHSIEVTARIELRWLEMDALIAWPPLEEFLSIIFFERQRDISVVEQAKSETVTADEMILLESLTMARWDLNGAARYLKCFLGETSAHAAAAAASRIRDAFLKPR